MPLLITLPATDDFWDEANQRFINGKEVHLLLEHSLLSLSKWERIWKKPFLNDASGDLSIEEVLSYVKCMTINQVDDSAYSRLTNDDIIKIRDYISDPMTASTFHDQSKNTSRDIITAEVIYYLMIEYGIWKECEKWPLGSLIALIKTCQIKNGGQKKMSRGEAAMFQKSLNESRLKKRR